MATDANIQLRDTRDRLIELLGLGKTYPLQDLPVRGEQLKVAFKTTAQIPIEDSQRGVTYQLFDRDKKPVGLPVEGNGGQLTLETPPVKEDITYRILATQKTTGLQAYLHDLAAVTVGLDTTLKARILAQALDPALYQPADVDPRLVDYRSVVRVQVDATQQGVSYRLIKGPGVANGPEISEQEVPGNLDRIVLQAKQDAIVEDMEIRIRATKTFEASENRAPDIDLLDVKLPLRVRARTDVPVAVAPSPPVVGYGQDATITIGQTQASVTYRLYVHRILDGEYVHGATKDPVIPVKMEGEPVQVRKPSQPALWVDPPGYAVAGEAKQGNGGDLTLTLKGPIDDSLVIVRAEKSHDAPVGKKIASAVQLEQPAVVLVRPDPGPLVSVEKIPIAPGTEYRVVVKGTQGGVKYQLMDSKGPVGNPGYDYNDRGIGTTRIEVDFVMDSKGPADVWLPTGPVQPPITFTIEATKVLTGLTAVLKSTAEVKVK